MSDKYNKTEESKKEFYFYLGLLSTLFAKMESNLLTILGSLIADDFVLTTTILERNSLAQNIELLKKLNNYRDYEKKSLRNLIDKISKIKGTRNLFIHGIWGEPFELDNDIIMTCDEAKLLYEEEKDANGLIENKSWASKTRHEFRLSYIQKLVENVEDIITVQNYFINKLSGHTF